MVHTLSTSMNSDAALLNRHQSLTAWAMNSGPLAKAHVGRCTPFQGELIQDCDGAVGVDTAVDVDVQGLRG